MDTEERRGAAVADHDLQLADDGADHRCVICSALLDRPGCCSLACVREARRERDANLARLRRLQGHDGPAATRARLTERNGRLTAALLAWR